MLSFIESLRNAETGRDRIRVFKVFSLQCWRDKEREKEKCVRTYKVGLCAFSRPQYCWPLYNQKIKPLNKKMGPSLSWALCDHPTCTMPGPAMFLFGQGIIPHVD